MIFVHFLFLWLQLSGSWVFAPAEDIYGYPSSACLSPEGELFVVLRNQNQVLKLSTDGQKSFLFGRKGQGPGEYEYAFSLRYLEKDGLLALMDGITQKVHFYYPNWDYQFSRTIQGPDQAWAGKVADRNTFIFLDTFQPITDAENRGAQLFRLTFGQKPELIQAFSEKVHQDPLFVVDGRASATAFPPWFRKVCWSVSPSGEWLCYGGNDSLNLIVLNLSNQQKGSFQETLPPRLLDSESVKSFSHKAVLNGNPHVLRDEKPPLTWPIVQSVQWDFAIRIWVEINCQTSPLEQETYWLFSVGTKKLGALILEQNQHFLTADQNSIWLVNSLGETWTIEKRPLILSD
ncbi:MAG: hypothetical protein H6510_05470 [Acidobacteria bacterium]|nr:hypothetical protein [Acidobacteriota bacterium]MCB9397243.1 hypothetical protein [Acidobacteriota bacterium]